MNRRAARWLAPILLLAAIVIAVTLGVPTARAEVLQSPTTASVVATAPEPPPVTANDFLPEDRNLSDCVGALEKPGCGSEERGGPMMNLVFFLVIAGMAFIFWRIIVGVRRNRARLQPAETVDP